MKKFTVIYNKLSGAQHTTVTDDEELAKKIVTIAKQEKVELVFYPVWNNKGVFVFHSEGRNHA